MFRGAVGQMKASENWDGPNSLNETGKNNLMAEVLQETAQNEDLKKQLSEAVQFALMRFNRPE